MALRGKKLPRVEMGDLLDRAKTLVGRTAPKRKKERDPDAYVRVVERPAREPISRDPQPTTPWDDE
jgi:hypothetical protein